MHRLEAVARDLEGLAIRPRGHYALGVDLQHHGGEYIAVVGVAGQRIVDRFFGFLRVVGEGDELLGAAVVLAALVVHDALAQGRVGGVLVAGVERGVHVQAAGVGLVAVLREDQLAHHFGHVFGMHAGVVIARAQFQFLGLGGSSLLCSDEAVLLHPLNDVELADACALGVADRVVGRGSLGQARQHGRFGDRDGFERLAEIRFGSGRETIGPVAQVDLVHVDLEDLVLRQQMLELESQQDFVDLAGEGLFRRQIDIARHLHGDGGGALALHAPQVGQRRTHHALVVHAAVLEEASVLDGQHRVRHHFRDVSDGREVASLLAELTQQRALARIDPERQLGTVVGQVGDVGQIGVGHGQRHGDRQHPRQHGGGRQACHPGQDAQENSQPRGPRSRRGRGFCVVGRHVALWEGGTRHYKN